MFIKQSTCVQKRWKKSKEMSLFIKPVRSNIASPVYEIENKLMTFPDKVPLEVAKAVSSRDRGTNTNSALSCNDRRAEKGKCLHVLTSPHLRILSVQTMIDRNHTVLTFLSVVVVMHKAICFKETQFRCEKGFPYIS